MIGCEPLTLEQVELTVEQLRGPWAARDVACFLLRVFTGFRVSEALSLRLGDVVIEGRMPDFIRVQRRNMKGKTSSRSVRFNEGAQEAVSKWVRQLHELGYISRTDFLFQSRSSGNRAVDRSSVYRIEVAACRRAGLTGHYGTHTARKTFAATARRMGATMFELQQMLGHVDPKSTAAYMSFDEKKAAERVMAMRRVRPNSPSGGVSAPKPHNRTLKG